MANDVLSDEQIANLIDAYGSPHEWADKEVAVALRELQHRRAQENSSLPGTLAAVQAQPVSQQPHLCPRCNGQGVDIENEPHEQSVSPCLVCEGTGSVVPYWAQPVSARPDVAQVAQETAEGIVCDADDGRCFMDELCMMPVDTAVDALAKRLREAFASVSPLRDETREPDTAGRVEALEAIRCAVEDVAAQARLAVRRVTGDVRERGWFDDQVNAEERGALKLVDAALQRARESAQGKTR
jgi:hypothetical protein